ncbi:MAG: tRNA 2-thiocytidine biosynthesis protein TtcA [Promethearchaeota archaeon]|nr:MAG: tRNA 2-thiocytidine biosynthesis protein TtcA [Candidatus Lokiarchaeota archaeon]
MTIPLPTPQQKSCSICNKKEIIYHRVHSGQFLCSECFVESIEKIIYKTISKFNLLRPQDKIIVGVSGGKDSLTLLYNLWKIQKNAYNSNPLEALSIDEGISSYSKKRVQKVETFCKNLDISLKKISFEQYLGFSLEKIKQIQQEKNDFVYPCNYCAILKRRLLNDVAKEMKGTVLALGHNLTDLAETYLMNILYNRYHLISRKTFVRRSSLSQEYYVERISPLMRIPEDEIELYAKLMEFNYYEPLCPFRTEFPIIRKKVLAFLLSLKKQSPEIEYNLFKGNLKLSRILHKNEISEPPNHCIRCGYPTTYPKKCMYCKLLDRL